MRTEKNMSLALANEAAQAAIDACTKGGYNVAVAVVDRAGQVKTIMRADNAGPHTTETARRKAYTALTFASRFPSSLAFATARGSTLGSPMPNVEGTVGVGGGVPIKVGEVAIGAVGVSGAVGGDKDEICANAGIAKVAHLLK